MGSNNITSLSIITIVTIQLVIIILVSSSHHHHMTAMARPAPLTATTTFHDVTPMETQSHLQDDELDMELDLKKVEDDESSSCDDMKIGGEEEEEEECMMMRRSLQAHLDYIYTQNHQNP